MNILSSQNKRSSLVKKNILGGILFRGTSILCSLLLVPLTISYISSELYGIWLTLSSIVQWIGFFDIGFGNGLRNKLGIAIANCDFKLGRCYVSTTYFIMGSIFLIVGVLGYLVCGFFNWSSILNVSQHYNSILISTVRIIVLSFSIQIVLKLLQNVIQSYQMNALASAMDTLGNILSLVFIFILTKTMAPSLPLIAIVFSVAPIIVLLLFSFIFYYTRFREISPRFEYIRIRYAKDLFSLGSKFFIIQIACLILFQMINVLISRICGPVQVTVYNIAYKYLNVSLMVFNIVLAPMWSAFTDAYEKKDYVWMKNIYHKLIKLCWVSTIILIIMVLISPFVYKIWIGNRVTMPVFVSAILSIYFIEVIWNGMHTSIINGIGKIKIQLYTAIIAMITFLPITIFLGHYFKIYGIIFSLILVNAPNLLLQRIQVKKILNQRAFGLWNK
jgi:O-antigen/teichoic acid export membrane protein